VFTRNLSIFTKLHQVSQSSVLSDFLLLLFTWSPRQEQHVLLRIVQRQVFSPTSRSRFPAASACAVLLICPSREFFCHVGVHSSLYFDSHFCGGFCSRSPFVISYPRCVSSFWPWLWASVSTLDSFSIGLSVPLSFLRRDAAQLLQRQHLIYFLSLIFSFCAVSCRCLSSHHE
jgi:hypothetical protein